MHLHGAGRFERRAAAASGVSVSAAGGLLLRQELRTAAYWFVGTRLYRDNLESYVQGRGMTRKIKVRIMVTVTLLMSVGFVMMHQVPVGRVVLGCVWVFHILYFCFAVKTIPAKGCAEI